MINIPAGIFPSRTNVKPNSRSEYCTFTTHLPHTQLLKINNCSDQRIQCSLGVVGFVALGDTPSTAFIGWMTPVKLHKLHVLCPVLRSLLRVAIDQIQGRDRAFGFGRPISFVYVKQPNSTTTCRIAPTNSSVPSRLFSLSSCQRIFCIFGVDIRRADEDRSDSNSTQMNLTTSDHPSPNLCPWPVVLRRLGEVSLFVDVSSICIIGYHSLGRVSNALGQPEGALVLYCCSAAGF